MSVQLGSVRYDLCPELFVFFFQFLLKNKTVEFRLSCVKHFREKGHLAVWEMFEMPFRPGTFPTFSSPVMTYDLRTAANFGPLCGILVCTNRRIYRLSSCRFRPSFTG
jgi:hypothetical protein